MLITRFSASWFTRELKQVRRSNYVWRDVMPPHAVLVAPNGAIGTGTGHGYGKRRVYVKGRYVRTENLPLPLVR